MRDLSDPPIASIIVPTRNRAALLARLLPSWTTQDLKATYEVIVVDNGSRDETARVIQSAVQPGGRVRLVTEREPGAGQARHAGVLAARAALLLFLDDDMEAQPDLLSRHLEAHGSAPRLCALGNVISASASRPFARMLAYIYDGGRQAVRERSPNAMDCWAGHLSLRRSVYFEVGGFDLTLGEFGGEDLDLGMRLINSGVDLRFLEAAVARHHFTASFGAALKRSYRNGVAFGYLASKHPLLPLEELGSAKECLPPLFTEIACHLAATILEPLDNREGPPMAPLALAYDRGLRAARQRGMTDYLVGRLRPTRMHPVPSRDA
jgi:glycosyltransferase involved in cell wall biosynthesis